MRNPRNSLHIKIEIPLHDYEVHEIREHPKYYASILGEILETITKHKNVKGRHLSGLNDPNKFKFTWQLKEETE
ncbi:hypothetical protein [Gudongella sp. SC589]|uniref:hypothetical protein n=1 Tax=Gudongella sp. SC589 TaxID=3385990 RepID=UPI0039046E04